jgi:hypothetical protein
MRATMTTTQNTPGSVPLYDYVVDNLNTDPVTGPDGDQAFISDFLFLDNLGSKNAIKGPAAGRNTFDMWFAPAAVSTAQWNNGTTGAFTAGRDPDNDARVVLRVLDVDGAGYGGEVDSGQICQTDLAIDRFDIPTKLYTVGNPDVYTLNPILSGQNGVSIVNVVANAGVIDGAGSVADFSVAPLTLTPLDPNGWKLELTVLTPGDTNNLPISDPSYGTGAASIDNYPVVWEADTLYQILVEASAPNATGETNGPDCLLIGADTHTNELLHDNYQLSGLDHAGMPKVGAAQPYTAFFFGHSGTGATEPEANRLRYKVDVISTDSYNRPAGTIYNQGGIRIHSIKVRKVHFIGE